MQNSAQKNEGINQTEDLKNARILIHGQSFIGDALMTTPFLRFLASCEPARLDILTDRTGLAVYSRLDYIDTVFNYTEDRLQEKIRRNKYSHAFVLKDSLKEAWRSFRFGIGKRLGFRRDGSGIFLTKNIKPEGLHGARKYFSLLDRQPEDISYDFPLREEEMQKARELLAGMESTGPLIVIVPGTTRPEKNWPAEYFIRLIQILQNRGYSRLLLCGSPGDRDRNQRIAGATNIADTSGQTSLGELGALLAKSDLVLSGDTGPMHIACAVPGPAVLALFGQTDPELTGPLAGHNSPKRVRVLSPELSCHPCLNKKCGEAPKCMRSIKAESVAEEIDTMLSATTIRNKAVSPTKDTAK